MELGLKPHSGGWAAARENAGGSAELFVDGESGIVFKSEDTQDLSGKLEMLLGNPLLASDRRLKGLDRCRRKYRFSDTLAALQIHL